MTVRAVHLKDKIQGAIANCVSYPKYSVGIFLNSNQRKQLLTDNVENFIKTTYGSNEIEHKFDSEFCTSIRFTNGSIIQLLNANSLFMWLARRCDCVMYDTDINRVYVDNIILRLVSCFIRNGKDLSNIIRVKF